VWWLQRAIYVLSHYRQKEGFRRLSFGVWLVPHVERKVLHFDVIANITSEGFQRMLALDDEVAEAWRSDETPNAANWVGRFAEAAGCGEQTVYNRQDKWLKAHGIDIAYPFALYRDILFFGHNSVADPENITKLMLAVENKDGEEVVRFHAEAIADFERKRIEIVNPALASRPRRMALNEPRCDTSELEDAEDEFEDLSLPEPVTPKKPLGPIAKRLARPLEHRLRVEALLSGRR
jgi:hypothetical protein